MFEKSKKYLASVFSAVAVFSSGGIATAQEKPAADYPRISGQVRYIQESLHLPGSGQPINFSTLPELSFKADLNEKLTTNLSFELDNTRGNGAEDWSDRGVRLYEANLRYSLSDQTTLEAGKLMHQRGALWLDAFPNGRPAITAEETSFTTAITNLTGVKLTHNIVLTPKTSLNLQGALVRTFPEINDSWGRREGATGGLADTWTPSMIVRPRLIHTLSDTSSLTAGVEFSRMAAGNATPKSETSIGGHVFFHKDLPEKTTFDLMTEATHFKNFSGMPGYDPTVATVYAQLTRPFNIAGTPVGTHLAAALNRDFNGDWSNSVESGLAVPVTNNLTAFVAGGIDIYHSGPSKGTGASVQWGAEYRFGK